MVCHLLMTGGIMSFTDSVKEIVAAASEPITPQEIHEQIKKNYPQYYGTTSHIRNVEKGHYKNLDHALLAKIYTLVGKNHGCPVNC